MGWIISRIEREANNRFGGLRPPKYVFFLQLTLCSLSSFLSLFVWYFCIVLFFFPIIILPIPVCIYDLDDLFVLAINHVLRSLHLYAYQSKPDIIAKQMLLLVMYICSLTYVARASSSTLAAPVSNAE